MASGWSEEWQDWQDQAYWMQKQQKCTTGKWHTWLQQYQVVGTSFTQAGTPDIAMCFVYLDLLLHLSQGQDCLLRIPICDIYGS